MEKQKIYDVHQLWTIYKSHKKWFLYSLLVCLCLGLSYIYWTRPLYSVTGKVQIIDRKGTNTVSASSLLQNQLPFGLGSSLGGSVSMETEKEILKSRLIARDAVEELGLYTEYRVRKWLRSRMLYKNSPILVTVSENTLNQMDESLPMMSYSIKLSIDKDDAGYRINGCVVENKDEKELPEIVSASLPASVNTSLGALKLAENNDLTDKDRKRFAKGYHLDVTIVPPMNKARMLAKKMSVSSPSKKSSSILLIEFNDENILRGIDYVNAIVENYNRQSNEEKHQEAAKNDEFVNERMVKIDAELNSVDARLEASKRKYQVTEPKVDAEEVMKKKSAYENQIVNIGIQQQMLDYLGEYVNDPANLYELIPMNVIGNTRDSIPLISRHNQLVNERKKMLSSMTEQTVQVRQNKELINELHPAIQTTILRSKEALLLQRTALEREYNKYMSRVGDVPEQERILTEIGRDRNIKQGVYVSLLQKREENAMELAKTIDKGRLADATLFNKKVKPRTVIVLALAFLIGLLLPYIFVFLRRWLRGTINDRQDLDGLTSLPVIGEIPSEGSRTEEAFISIRSNLLHQMGADKKTILVTSDTLGDGKTYTAIRLAEAIAKMGKKVLLCDLDFRNPSVARELHIQEEKGLCSILTGNDTEVVKVLESVRHSSIAETLDVLVPGRMPSVHPANLLAHENLLKAMSLLRDQYDFIVHDAPSVGQYDDALIDGLADVTCYVCRSGKTPKTAIDHLNELSDGNRLASPMILVNSFK